MSTSLDDFKFHIIDHPSGRGFTFDSGLVSSLGLSFLDVDIKFDSYQDAIMAAYVAGMAEVAGHSKKAAEVRRVLGIRK